MGRRSDAGSDDRSRAAPPDAAGRAEAAACAEREERPIGPGERVRLRTAGWSLGSACPYGCLHCYTEVTRRTSGELNSEAVERVVAELARREVRTVVLGGNEPIFAGGSDVSTSLLPRIIDQLDEHDISPVLVTSGLSVRLLADRWPGSVQRLAAVAVSLDAPTEVEHNRNRGAALFSMALEALGTCRDAGVPSVILTVAMSWNFSLDRIEGFLDLAREQGSLLRVNTYKSAGGLADSRSVTREQYWPGYRRLVEASETLVADEPPLRAWFGSAPMERNCGVGSVRIGFPRPDGALPVTPCQYRPELAVDLDLDIDAAVTYGAAGVGRQPVCIDYDAYGPPPYAPREARTGSGPMAALFSDYLCTWLGRPL